MIGPTGEEIHKIEQATAALKEHFIPLLYSFYEGCLNAGFNKKDALQLTISYMKTLLQG